MAERSRVTLPQLDYRAIGTRTVQTALHVLPVVAIAMLWPAREAAVYGDPQGAASSEAWAWFVGELSSTFEGAPAAVAAAAGLVSGLIALALAQATASTSWDRIRRVDPRWPALLVPAAGCLVVGLPAYHEVLTDGSDTGLLMLWMASSAWGVATADSEGGRTYRAILIGFGPLIRPELVLLATPLLIALATSAHTTRERFTVIAAALAPTATELFVMGGESALIGHLVPALQTFRSSKWLGLGYVRPIIEPKWLLVALGPVIVMALRLTMRAVPDIPRRAAIATMVGGAMLSVWIARIGGEHGPRALLLAALFAAILPASMWPITPRRGGSAFALVSQTVLLLLLPIWAL